MIITPATGQLTFYSDPPLTTVAPAVRPVPRVVLLVTRPRSVERRSELIHGPPLAA